MDFLKQQWNNLTIEVTGATAVVTLNRPDSRNALSIALMEELTNIAQQIRRSTSIQAVVLTAAGDSFTAGADMSPGETLQAQPETLLERRQAARLGPDMCSAWENLEQVTIAAIEGYCIGGGTALVAACDFRIAGESAYFRLPEVALGINMSWHSIPRLVALVGPSRAKQLAIFCESLPASQAAQWGLVDEVTPDRQARTRALAWAEKVTALPPLPVRMVKEAVNASALALARATIFMDRDQILVTSQSQDFREGIDAFLEKRKPDFTGN